MKHHLLLILFFFVLQYYGVQPIIVKNDATQMLFSGGVNPISIHVDHYKPSELTPKVSIGSIAKASKS